MRLPNGLDKWFSLPMRMACSAVLVACCGGCATILSGTEQKVPITTDPSGASVLVDGNASYTTPVDLKLTRKDEHTLLVSMPGYHTVRVEVKKKVNPLVFGNALVGGLIGASADIASGATNALTPKRINILFQRVGPGEMSSILDFAPPDQKNKDDAPERSKSAA